MIKTKHEITPMVKLIFEWHHGIPDGEGSFEHEVPYFDVENEEETKEQVHLALQEYGVDLSTFTSFEKSDTILAQDGQWAEGYEFKCEIGDHLKTERAFKQFLKVKLYFKPYLLLGKKKYELKEIV